MFEVPDEASEVSFSDRRDSGAPSPSFSLSAARSELRTLSLPQLRSLVISGAARSSQLRHIHWLVLLGVLPPDSGSWETQIACQRERVRKLWDGCRVEPEEEELDHPLANSEQSLWAQAFQDQRLCQIIMLDVQRTHPENAFFADTQTVAVLKDVLFLWCKLNPELSYRQGMNEILAPIVLVVARSHVVDDEPKDLIENLCQKQFITEDCYLLFEAVMKRVAKFYATDGQTDCQPAMGIPRNLESLDPLNTRSGNTMNPVVASSNRIQRDLLPRIDSALAKHLEQLGIEPQVYGLRWLRLLFAREFHIEDVLIIWDVLFAKSEPESIDICLYFSLAMLQNIRDFLIRSDMAGCLQRLLKFPPVEDVFTLIIRAGQLEAQLKSHHVEDQVFVQESASKEAPQKVTVFSNTANQRAPRMVSEVVQKISKIQLFGGLLQSSSASSLQPRTKPLRFNMSSNRKEDSIESRGSTDTSKIQSFCHEVGHNLEQQVSIIQAEIRKDRKAIDLDRLKKSIDEIELLKDRLLQI